MKPGSMITVDDAYARVMGGVAQLGAEQVSITNALGRVLAQAVASRLTQPPVAVSSMDGYAVIASDTTNPSNTLTLVGESAAGGGFDGTVVAGQTVRIFTGAPVPNGADAVEMQENCEAAEGTVTINTTVEPGNFIRAAGMDFAKGQELLPKGRIITARDIGLLAAMNVPWVQVTRRPRVAILATGNELVMPGEDLGPTQIISSNSLSLAAMVTALGGTAENLGIARDDEASLHAMLGAAKGADLLVTIGGASVGDYDLVRKVLGDEGMEMNFYKVAMKPGKPLIFGRIGDTPVLGVPGNPVSANVTALLFLRAALEAMLGIEASHLDLPSARLAADLPKGGPRQEYLRAKLTIATDGRAEATPHSGQDSALLARLADADCLIIRPPHAAPAKAGDEVRYMALGAGLGTT